MDKMRTKTGKSEKAHTKPTNSKMIKENKVTKKVITPPSRKLGITR